jgi:hypothetical protein
MVITKHINLLFFSFMLSFTSCGDATAVKVYNYKTTKENLEKAVTKVVEGNPNIVLDTTRATVIVRRNPNDKNDTSTITINLSDFHGKDSAQVAAFYKGQFKVSIKSGNSMSYFTLRYIGDEQSWKSSTTSAIFISEATDGLSNKISQGHNENGQFKSKPAQELAKMFERNVVDNVDKELQINHSID